MTSRLFRVRAVAILVLASGVLTASPVFAAASPQSAKAKAANSAYVKALAHARADYLAAVKPSRDAALLVGKPAEAIRRARVKAALDAFNLVVSTAKAPSLADEKSYKAAVANLAANPGNASLKAAAKASLTTLTQATAALKVDPKVAAARSVFAAARASTMAEFKATVMNVAKTRDAIQATAMTKFKAAKAKAAANLKAALKAAQSKSAKAATKKKK
ncbi:hypothetical protein GALL_318420 [mine drainage metagenome]|uniref:Uncharacterized protein n=1 Tax=mine drainage metagenome TaxID=410659 RepID=A0A1J5QSH5_9ZZZZ